MFYEFHIQGVGSRRHPFSGQFGLRCSKSNGWLRVKKKSVNEITTTPSALLHYQPRYHENSCRGTVRPVVFTQPQEVKHSLQPTPTPNPSHYRKNAIRFMTFIILYNSVNVMFTFSPMFSFQKKKEKKS